MLSLLIRRADERHHTRKTNDTVSWWIQRACEIVKSTAWIFYASYFEVLDQEVRENVEYFRILIINTLLISWRCSDWISAPLTKDSTLLEITLRGTLKLTFPTNLVWSSKWNCTRYKYDSNSGVSTLHQGPRKGRSFFAWVNFFGLQMTWYEFYHSNVPKRVYSCMRFWRRAAAVILTSFPYTVSASVNSHLPAVWRRGLDPEWVTKGIET